jgi:hypothetical protein
MFEERKKSGIRRILLIAFLVFVIIVFVVILVYENPSELKSSVTLKASLNPSTVKVGENSRLKLEFKNQDLESHQISCTFKANSKVTIYSGNNPLVDNRYSIVLDASDPAEERIFDVNALLEEWVYGSDYTIYVSLYVDGNEIGEESQKLTLSVKES